MATTASKPRRGAGSKNAKGGTSKAATSKATRGKAAAAKTDDGPSKRDLQRAQNDELREQVVVLRDEEDNSWGEIAEELSITSGKAQFLHMQATVASTPKLKIKHADEDELIAGIIEAREAEDEHSSWGWIAARTGVSEAKVKRLAEEGGVDVAGSNVAVKRAEANGGGEKADRKTAKQGGRAKSGAKAAAAKKRAAARKRPS